MWATGPWLSQDFDRPDCPADLWPANTLANRLFAPKSLQAVGFPEPDYRFRGDARRSGAQNTSQTMKRLRLLVLLRSSQFRWVTYGVLLAAAVNLLIGWARSWEQAPSIASQLEAIRAGAEREGYEPIIDRTVDLKASGQNSHLFVFRDHWPLGKPWREGRPLSDLIELYSESAGLLRPAFRFQARRIRGATPVYFKLLAIRDVDGNGRPEIVGAFEPWAADTLEASPIPAVITWDDASRSFRMFPLTARPPQIDALAPPGIYSRGLRKSYENRVTIRDTQSPLKLRGFPVSAFAIARSSHGKPAILESFVVKASCHFCIQELEVQLLTTRYQAPPETFSCTPLLAGRDRLGILVRVPQREWAYARPSEFLERNSARFARRFECVL